MNPNAKASWITRAFRALCRSIGWFLLAIATLWAAAALYFDLSFSRVPVLTPILYLVVIVTITYFAKRHFLRMAVFLAGFLIVLFCWLSLKPATIVHGNLTIPKLPGRKSTATTSPSTTSAIATIVSELDFTCEWLTKTVFPQ